MVHVKSEQVLQGGSTLDRRSGFGEKVAQNCWWAFCHHWGHQVKTAALFGSFRSWLPRHSSAADHHHHHHHLRHHHHHLCHHQNQQHRLIICKVNDHHHLRCHHWLSFTKAVFAYILPKTCSFPLADTLALFQTCSTFSLLWHLPFLWYLGLASCVNSLK